MDRVPSPFGRYRSEVDAMIADGQPFSDVEDVIEHSTTDPDEQAALWLYAWARFDAAGGRRYEQRRLQPV